MSEGIMLIVLLILIFILGNLVGYLTMQIRLCKAMSDMWKELPITKSREFYEGVEVVDSKMKELIGVREMEKDI